MDYRRLHKYWCHLRRADVVWDNCPNYIKEKLQHINYEAARIITGATKLTSIRLLLQECGWETLEQNIFMELTEILLFIFARNSFQSRTVEGKKLLL
jgi:hypothetical protein